MASQDILKRINNVEEMMKVSIALGKDALVFVAEKGMIDEFMDFHVERQKKLKKD
jgi:hypothetical protein